VKDEIEEDVEVCSMGEEKKKKRKNEWR